MQKVGEERRACVSGQMDAVGPGVERRRGRSGEEEMSARRVVAGGPERA